MRHATLLFCLAIAIMTSAKQIPAQESAMRTLSVSGEGKATSPPDMATINTGIITQAATAREALSDNNATMDKILAALKKFQIAEKDIQTSNFSVQPEYARGQHIEPSERRIVGYRVSNQVTVQVRNLPKLGEVMDALVQAGSNQFSGVSFGIDDPTGVLNQARNRAIADARSRAQLYAQAAGVRVGKVISISEQPIAQPRPQYMARGPMMMAEAAGSVPVATGEQELTATVHMIFALEDN
jgi:uncharacterized protein YggE